MKTNEEKDLAQEVADKLRRKFTDKLSNNVRKFEKDTQVNLHKSLQDIAKIAATSGTKWLAQPNVPGLTAGRIGDLFLDLKTLDVYLKETKLGWVKQANLAGTPGKDAITPVKGVDYFDGKDGYTPIKGRDYFDGKDGKDAKQIEMRVSNGYIQWTREGEPWRNLISVEELKGAPGRAVRIGGGGGGASLEIGSLVTGAQPNRALFTDEEGKLTDDILESIQLSFFGGLLEGTGVKPANFPHSDSIALGGVDASGLGGFETFGVLQSKNRDGGLAYVKVDYDNLDTVPPESMFLIGYDADTGQAAMQFFPEGQITNPTPFLQIDSSGIVVNASQSFNEVVTELTGATDNQIPTALAVADAIAGVGGGGAWGSITGTLSDQTDVWDELQSKMELIGTVSMGSRNINFYDGSSTVSILSYTPSTAGEVLYIRTAGTADLGSGTPLTLSVGDFIIWDTHGLPSWKILYKANVLDTDGTLAANSDTVIASQKAVKTYVDNAVTGLLDFKGSTNASTNPNYPSALKGDAYVVSAAGKVGGASGKSVDIGDVYLAIADNAGGTEASVGTSWIVLEHNLQGALLSANNLSDLASASTARTNLGLGSGALLVTDTDYKMAANLDTNVATQKATKAGIFAKTAAIKPTSGDWYSMGGQTAAGTAGLTGAGQLRFHPIWLDEGNISEIAVSTSVAAASTWRLGLYEADPVTGLPDGMTPFWDAGTVNMNNTAGVQTIVSSKAVTKPGLYWAAILVDAYTAQPTTHNCVYSSNTGGAIHGLPQDMSSLGRYRVGRTYGSTVPTGSLPTAPTSSMSWSGTIPRVAVKYS